MTPFSLLFYASRVAEGATDQVVEVMAALAGAGVALFGLYKLGTVETVLKIIISVILAVGALYGVGYFYPPFQEAAWYQLIAWLVEVGPQIILEKLGGTTS